MRGMNRGVSLGWGHRQPCLWQHSIAFRRSFSPSHPFTPTTSHHPPSHPAGASLERLHAALHAHTAAGDATAPLLVDGCPLPDLCLTFELPGRPAYPLHADGAEVGNWFAGLCVLSCWEGAGGFGRRSKKAPFDFTLTLVWVEEECVVVIDCSFSGPGSGSGKKMHLFRSRQPMFHQRSAGLLALSLHFTLLHITTTPPRPLPFPPPFSLKLRSP